MTVQTLAIVVLLVSFFVMIFLRFPIAYAVGLSSVLCMMVQGQALTDVCRLMVKGISSFSLMAVPFFITMGVLMGSGGISEKLIALADACVGWMRGGNQQKAIIAREIDKDPKLLVAVQPTRGLDVGAIEYIHRQIVAQRDKGKAVLLVSLELDEVMNLSDRILVMYEGEIVGEFDPKTTTVQELGLYMAGARKQGKESK